MSQTEELTKITGIADVREIVTGSSYKTFTWGDDGDDLMVDMQTANMLCTIYDALRPALQTKYSDMLAESRHRFIKLVDFGWDQVRPA